ncbi:MAG TPA: hypothetical protein PLK12_07555 [Prolixibacteraceae bacterium]|nr:hypothetical protein [Prolixibacteraceae bacterium]
MVLIAESGSTKTQWCSLKDGKLAMRVNTPGINPFLLSVDEMECAFRPVTADLETAGVRKIFFFGAGCSLVPTREKVGKALNMLFPNASLLIDSDLVAACLALSGEKPGIVALLGTGSNSCLWDGRAIINQVPSLGYILGDEGGGVSMGKVLVSDFLKNQMPLHLRIQFMERYDVSTSLVLERVYQKPMPNRFLASFAPFLEMHIDDEYCQKIIQQQFQKFVIRNLLSYQQYDELESHFCGSIAWGFRAILQQVCREYSIRIGKVEKEPIAKLAQYLKEKEIS